MKVDSEENAEVELDNEAAQDEIEEGFLDYGARKERRAVTQYEG